MLNGADGWPSVDERDPADKPPVSSLVDRHQGSCSRFTCWRRLTEWQACATSRPTGEQRLQWRRKRGSPGCCECSPLRAATAGLLGITRKRTKRGQRAEGRAEIIISSRPNKTRADSQAGSQTGRQASSQASSQSVRQAGAGGRAPTLTDVHVRASLLIVMLCGLGRQSGVSWLESVRWGETCTPTERCQEQRERVRHSRANEAS